MALKGKIYSIARQHDDLNTNELFQSMIDKSAAQDTIVMDGRNIAAGSIFAEQIHTNAITAKHIETGAIETGHMDAGTIDVSVLKGSQLILPGKNYGGVVVNNNGLTMKSTGTAKLDIKLSSESGFNITDGSNNQLIDINPSTGNVKMQVNEMIIGGYSAATTKDIDDIEVGGRNLFSLDDYQKQEKETSAGSTYRYVFQGEPLTKYTISTDIPSGSLYDLFFDTHPSTPSSRTNGVSKESPRTVTTDDTGLLNIFLRYARSAAQTAIDTDVIEGEYHVQLERGNKATDWTPAPEDVQAEIDSRPTFQDFDQTDKVTINGGNIKAGTISSKNSYSTISLEDGTFNFGNGKFVWDGSIMTVDADDINLSGKVTFNDFSTSLQTTVDSKVTQSDVDSLISDVKDEGRNYLRNSDFSLGTEFWSGDGSLVDGGLLLEGISGPSSLIQNITEVPEGNYTLQVWYEVLEGQAPYLFNNGGSDAQTPNIYPFEVDKEYFEVGITIRASNLMFAFRYGGGSPANHLVGKTLIKRVQLEKGTKITDWKPAPEDLEAKATDAKNKTDSWTYSGETTIDGGVIQADTITAAQIAADSITANELDVDEISALTSKLGDVTAGTITSENGNIYIDLNEGFMNVAEGLFKIQGKDIADTENLGQIEEKMNQEIEHREEFISYVNGIVTIGQKDSPTNIQIKNDRISFMQNGTEVAYITEQTMEITHGIFVETAKIGEHKQQTLSGGHTVFTWEG